MAREWHDAASEAFGRVLHGDPTARQAALAVLKAAKDAQPDAMAAVARMEIRLRRCSPSSDGI